jgi:tRNA dimethylallyltransferase
LRAKLDAADPVAATTIHANDRRRTIRALEVAATGRTISSLQTQWTSPPRPDALLIGLSWPTAAINARINERVRCMLKQGLLEEVRALAPMLGPQAAAALGYKQFLEVLDGTDTQLNDAGEQVKIRTRRFAKGQRTWLRRFQGVKLSLWLDAPNKDPQHIATEALTWVLKQGHG